MGKGTVAAQPERRAILKKRPRRIRSCRMYLFSGRVTPPPAIYHSQDGARAIASDAKERAKLFSAPLFRDGRRRWGRRVGRRREANAFSFVRRRGAKKCRSLSLSPIRIIRNLSPFPLLGRYPLSPPLLYLPPRPLPSPKQPPS